MRPTLNPVRLNVSGFHSLLIVTSLVVSCHPVPAGIGARFPSEKTAFIDAVSGITVTALTTNAANDSKIYQTHPQWTADGDYIVFRSNRAGDGSQAFAVHEATGEIVQLTGGSGNNTGSLNVARKSMKLYFLRGGSGNAGVSLIELDLATLLADSRGASMKSASAYERVCATFVPGMRDSGGFALDADEKTAYVGVRGGDVGQHLPAEIDLVETASGQRMGGGPGGIRSVNLETGEIRVVLDTPFQMGHVQANPWVPGEILYCHETGGDAPQRMWAVKTDGSGNRPVYRETPDEWITHEAFIAPDEVVFNIMGHQPRLRSKPTGIAVINLRTDEMKLYGQVEAGQGHEERGRGFWHSNGSPDGEWLVGDTFAGNLWLIHRKTGLMKLLSTDHRMRPDHCHPTFSPDSKRILFQSGHLSEGNSLDLMVIDESAWSSAANP